MVLTAIAAVIMVIVVVASTQTVGSNNERQADDLVACINAGRSDCD